MRWYGLFGGWCSLGEVLPYWNSRGIKCQDLLDVTKISAFGTSPCLQ